jgi:hypothetical protein
MRLIEQLSPKNEQKLYAEVLNISKRAKTPNPRGHVFYGTLMENIKNSYIELITLNLFQVEVVVGVLEDHLVRTGLSWDVQMLYKEFGEARGAYLADVLLPLLFLEMEEKKIPYSTLTHYIVGIALLLIAPEYINPKAK